MNLLLLDEGDFRAPGRVELRDRRLRHARRVLRTAPGEQLRVGLVGGRRGSGEVLRIDEEALELAVCLDREPPPKLPLTLILALPRPKVLRRVLQAVTSLGAAHIYLIHAYRVEKSYWQSPFLEPTALEEQLRLGLEQAGDTMLPKLEVRRRFRPFVEDELPALAERSSALVADPRGEEPCPRGLAGEVTLAVGPEGGFIPFELELLERAGCRPVHLGERILRVETALPALVGRIF
ncbi:MAG: 16S rRNA (uracil(1498)-N(3))-methyltransferase [Acidobacteriota bacterium]|nr:16S rRNA (uracil(1498)-N(3))-methyltransferase [Acidobacteriota bacterium]